MKKAAKKYLAGVGCRVTDTGTSSEESVDYPDFAHAVAQQAAPGACQMGLLFCGTGIGMAMAANKVAGVRAANVHNLATARLAREHNNANVLALGTRIVSDAAAIAMVRKFMRAEFAGGRHQRRINKISALDECK
jgi:ribose 5-phosphate isomerase B